MVNISTLNTINSSYVALSSDKAHVNTRETTGNLQDRISDNFSVDMEKFKLFAKIDGKNDSKDEKVYVSLLNEVKQTMTDNIIDEKYLRNNQKEIYSVLEADSSKIDKKEVKMQEKIVSENIKGALKDRLQSVNSGSEEIMSNKCLESRLKQLINVVDDFPEEKKLDLYTTISLQGFLIAA